LRKIEETKINLIQSNLIKKESLTFRVFKNLKLKTPNLKPINMNYLIKYKHMKHPLPAPIYRKLNKDTRFIPIEREGNDYIRQYATYCTN